MAGLQFWKSVEELQVGDPSRKQELFAFQKMKLSEEIQMILEESQPQKQKLGQLQGESSR